TGHSPRGSVTFKDGDTVLRTLPLTGQDSARHSQRFAIGAHQLTVVYSGDAANAPSTSDSVVLEVGPTGSLTRVSASANPSVYGAALTLSASVTGNRALQGGSVTFYDGAATLGGASISGNGLNGTASLA